MILGERPVRLDDGTEIGIARTHAQPGDRVGIVTVEIIIADPRLKALFKGLSIEDNN